MTICHIKNSKIITKVFHRDQLEHDLYHVPQGKPRSGKTGNALTIQKKVRSCISFTFLPC